MSFAHAYFENLETKEQMQVQFNPTELTFSKSAQFAEIAIPGLDAPVQQFIRGGTETLTVELFFDTTDEGMAEGAKSVTDERVNVGIDKFWGTDKFYQLVKQNSNTHAPPRCRFSWGKSSEPSKPLAEDALKAPGQEQVVSKAPFWFICIVESIDRKFVLFNPEGVPLRARLTVKLREYQTIEQMIAKLQTADHTKTRILKRRQRLDQLAANEYDTPAEWRRIADANDVDDPRQILPGTNLVIPPILTESVIWGDRP
jgi:Contractile injection system tube protein